MEKVDGGENLTGGPTTLREKKASSLAGKKHRNWGEKGTLGQKKL